MKDVVICYAKEDKKQARQLNSRLETNGIKCWIAPRDINPGAKYEEALSKAIEGAEILILILSQASEKSEKVGKELEIAAENKIPIIPFKIGATSHSMPVMYMLSSLDWVDAHQESFDEAYEILLEIIEEISQGRTVAQAPREKKIENTSKNTDHEGCQQKKTCIIAAIAAVLLIVGFLAFFNNGDTSNDYASSASTKKLATNTATENAIVPTKHNITEKVKSVEGEPLVGVWKISNYSDSRKISPSERAVINQNINALKKVALVVFRADNTFMRAGFTAQPQNGTWEIDKKKGKVYLTPSGSGRRETINLIALNDSVMKMVVVEPQKNALGAIENVTTQINFKKQ